MGWHEAWGWMLGAGGLPVRLALAGGLGAVVNCALDEEPVLLPRLRGHRLELGFLGNLTTCLVVAQIVGHDFTQGFLAALAGTAILRTLKRRIEKACEDELARLEEER